MPPLDEHHWAEYYRAVANRPPRPIFARLQSLYPPPAAPVGGLPAANGLQAIDLGCGDGKETLLLLEMGFTVLALDQQPQAIELTRQRAGERFAARLVTQAADFHSASLPPCDLLFAGMSLPFCPPAQFAALWARVTGCLRPGGRFAGHLFGGRDSWRKEPEMTFFESAEARQLFEGFELEVFDEIERDGASATQGVKHWHLFEVIARKG